MPITHVHSNFNGLDEIYDDVKPSMILVNIQFQVQCFELDSDYLDSDSVQGLTLSTIFDS